MTLLASVMLLASACTGKQASEKTDFWTGTCELPYGSGWQADRLVCFGE